MSAVAAVSSLGAGNSKGAVLRLMPQSLSTGAELKASVAADGVAAGGMRLSETGAGIIAASLLLMGAMTKGDLMVLVGGDTAPACQHRFTRKTVECGSISATDQQITCRSNYDSWPGDVARLKDTVVPGA
jgi:hypothetical protein